MVLKTRISSIVGKFLRSAGPIRGFGDWGVARQKSNSEAVVQVPGVFVRAPQELAIRIEVGLAEKAFPVDNWSNRKEKFQNVD